MRLYVYNIKTYAMVGFGETPGTLWVWVSGLPKMFLFGGPSALQTTDYSHYKEDRP